jgi:hypothetical protein
MLPSFVDDVIDVGGTLPATGDVGKIYVVSSGANANKIYRWSGSTFVEISPSPGSTDSVTEGSVNLYHTTARAAAAAPVQSVAGRTGTISLSKSDVALGNVDNTADASKPVSTAQAAADTAVQSFAIQRANHTGTQTASTISDFPTEAAKYGPVVSVNGQTGAVTVSGGGSANIVERSHPSDFPRPGASNTLYVSRYGQRLYRYDSSGVYVEIGTGTPGEAVTAPSAPTGVTGVAGDGRVALSWSAPSNDGGASIYNYGIEYSSDGGSTWTLFAPSTSSSLADVVTGLANGTAYVFRVIAANTAVGTGAWSAPSSPVTPTAANTFGNVSLLLHMEGTTLVDSSSNSLTVTALEDGRAPTNPFLVTTEKKFGSKSFSGIGAGYSVSAETQTSSALGFGAGDYCLEGWSYTNNALSDFQYLFYLPNGIFVAIQRVDGIPQLRINNGSWQYSDAVEVPHGQWNYIAVARTSGQINAYVNGTRVFTGADSRNYGASDKFYTAINLNGYVDEIRVSKGTNRGMSGATVTVPTTAFPDS